MSQEIAYLEVGPRLYEVTVVPGLIRKDTRWFRCRIDHDAQRISVSDTVPEGERMDVAAQAVSEIYRPSVVKTTQWRAVPVTGRVS
jgi:hypothetical protein